MRKIDEKPLPVPIPQTQPVAKKPPLLNPLIARFSGASEEEVQVPSAEDYYGSRSGRSCNYRDEMFAGQGSSSSSSVTEFKTYEKVNDYNQILALKLVKNGHLTRLLITKMSSAWLSTPVVCWLIVCRSSWVTRRPSQIVRHPSPVAHHKTWCLTRAWRSWVRAPWTRAMHNMTSDIRRHWIVMSLTSNFSSMFLLNPLIMP